MAGEVQNYTVGRGRILFARFKPGTQEPDGFRYIGNSPEFNMSIESEDLDHFSSDHGIREKDDSVPLTVTRTGSMTTDNIVPENVAMFFFGTTSVIAQVLQAGESEVFADVKPGYIYKLGQTAARPFGFSGISKNGFNLALVGATLVAATGTLTFSGAGTEGDTISIGGFDYTLRAVPVAPFDVDIGATAALTAANLVAAITAGADAGTAYGTGTLAHPDVTASAATAVITVTALVTGTGGNAITTTEDGTGASWGAATLSGGTGTSYVEGTDYTMDYEAGNLSILSGGAIASGVDVEAFYTVRASTRTQIISGDRPVEGAMQYVSANPKGDQFNWYMPWVKITPNGDYALKGDEWQTIPFNIETLKPEGASAIYINGAAAYI